MCGPLPLLLPPPLSLSRKFTKNEDWLNIKNYIESNPDINEVILSGGDPLTLSNRKLALWLERLSSLKQVKILRIHSRVPIVIPNRIDEELISLLKTVGCVLFWWYTQTMLLNSMTLLVQNCCSYLNTTLLF